MGSDGGGPAVAGVNGALLEAFEPYIDALAERLAVKLSAGRDRMINQHDSELGPRRHRDAVKRRLANGEGGAGITPNGRGFLLTKEAMREELSGKGRPGRGKGPSGAPAPSGGGDGSPSSGGSGAKSRAHDLAAYERELMGGLRAVKETR